MIITNGEVTKITVTPADPQADPPVLVEMASVQVKLSQPEGSGTVNFDLPNAAMGGIVQGPCRLMIESA